MDIESTPIDTKGFQTLTQLVHLQLFFSKLSLFFLQSAINWHFTI